MAIGPCPVEGVDVINARFWRGRRVFLTGHTGFKGGWLALWLTELGAKVYGYALPPPTEPNLFTLVGLEKRLAASTIADIRDAKELKEAITAAQPEIVLHLAAQPLVRRSYAEPLETFAVNLMGTVNLFEAVRSTPGVKAVVNVTTDKCYENREWIWPYRENEPLGGHDPYSASKACAELATAAYRRSFLAAAGVHVASARAGNVIGGGDWSPDRLLPDFLRALEASQPLLVRSPQAIRPWQHVLEPLAGYLLLAEKLFTIGEDFAEAWNFGPAEEDTQPVQWLVESLCQRFPGARWQCDPTPHPHEAATLKLDSAKARARLGWRPRWRLQRALQATLDWHLAWKEGRDMTEFTLCQINDYVTSEHSA